MRRNLIVLAGIVLAAFALVLHTSLVEGSAANHDNGTSYTVYAEDKGPTVIFK